MTSFRQTVFTVIFMAYSLYRTGLSASINESSKIYLDYELNIVTYGPCLCGFDKRKDITEKPSITFRPGSWITCNTDGMAICEIRCKQEIHILLNRYCLDENHSTLNQGYSYVSLCEGLSWKLIENALQEPICCHDKHKIPCVDAKSMNANGFHKSENIWSNATSEDDTAEITSINEMSTFLIMPSINDTNNSYIII